jgi:hypothetical protein
MRDGGLRMTSRLRWIALAIGVMVLGYCWWHWAQWRQQAYIAAGFAARVGCSCRHVQGRPLDSCASDLKGLPGMRLVRLSERPDDRAVDATIPLLSRRTARAAPGFGCIIESR